VSDTDVMDIAISYSELTAHTIQKLMLNSQLQELIRLFVYGSYQYISE